MYDWLSLDNKQKENFIFQIVEQIRIFHSIKFDKYSIRTYLGSMFDDYRDAVAASTDFNKIDKTKLKKRTQRRC